MNNILKNMKGGKNKMSAKAILLLIITIAFIGATINDWTTYNLLGKVFMVVLDFGFAGLTYKEFNQ